MKANEFVKKFGWEEAAEIVCGVPEKFRFKCLSNVCWDNNTYKYSDRFKPRLSLVNMADLKRLVESHELVESFGGLKMAKESLKNLPSEYQSYTMTRDDTGATTQSFKLNQAIFDVESCQ